MQEKHTKSLKVKRRTLTQRDKKQVKNSWGGGKVVIVVTIQYTEQELRAKAEQLIFTLWIFCVFVCL